jgi:lipopolysaccharide transport system ATP-binding protein
MSSNYVIEGQEVAKSYRVVGGTIDRVRQLFSKKARQAAQQIHALKSVSFTIEKGDAVALVGVNGSGKSTLLHLICNTLKPTHGKIIRHGKIAALLELGTGFDPEFTGLENVRLNATFHGLTKEQLDQKLQQILDFADIGEFIHQPLKTYSSGMVLRLAFATIAHVDADILVIDEALAVGDAIFSQKCMRFIRDFKKHGTLLFVSHDMAAVQSLCNKAIWLDKGSLLMAGPVKEITEAYLHYSLQKIAGEERTLSAVAGDRSPEVGGNARTEEGAFIIENIAKAQGWNTGAAKIESVSLINADFPEKQYFQGGENVLLRITGKAVETLKSPILGFLLRDRLGQDLFGTNTYEISKENPVLTPAGAGLEAEFRFKMPYLPNGQYAVACSIADGNLQENVQHHFLHDALIITVSSSANRWGLVGIPFDGINLRLIDGGTRVSKS